MIGYRRKTGSIKKKQGLKKFLAVCLSLTLLLSCGLIGGCNQGMLDTQSILDGWVSAGEPISGATLSIYDIEGDQIYQSEEPATGDFGSFLIAVTNFPSDFRIVASGGMLDGESFSADLSADYRDFDPETGTVYINPVTTMVSTYLDNNPDKTLDEAMDTVKSYLEIPEWFDIGRGLQAQADCFSHSTFISEATNNGGISDFTSQLVTEMADGTAGATRPFINEAESNEMIGDAGSFIASNLASGALSYLGGNVMGWGLSQLGLGFGDKTAEQLAEIKSMLEQMQQQLNEMQQQLNQISQQLDQLSMEVEKLRTEIKQSSWDDRIGQLSALLINISRIREDLMSFVSAPPADPEVLNAKRASIMERIETQLLNHDDDIHSQLVGIASATPMLKLWSQLVKGQRRFLDLTDSAKVQEQFDYFDTVQLWLTELIVEYYHAKASDEETNSPMYNMYTSNANDAITRYNEHRTEQEALLLPALPAGVFYDRDQTLLIKPQIVHGSWELMFRMFTQWGSPPTVITDRPFPSWAEAWEKELFSMLDKSGGNPYDYAISEGWPNGSLNRSWTLGVGWSQTSDNTFMVWSLSDNSTYRVSCTSPVEYHWVLVVEPWIMDPQTLDDTLVQFFW